MDRAERVRLLYVALTRAMDHLIVSAHRLESSDRATDEPSMAEMVVDNAAHLPQAEWQPRPLSTKAMPVGTQRSLLDWRSEREAALAAARRPPAMSASAIASLSAADKAAADEDPGLAKDGPNDGDDQLPPWQKGRYGTKIGSAVHGVLQTIALDADRASLDPVVAAQAEGEGVPQHRSTVRALAESVLESSTVQQAATGQHWKELFVATPVEGTVVEGYVDLLFRSEKKLVVVDYKTDYIPDDEALSDKIDRYRLQVAAYSLAVEQAVEEPVARCVLVFAQEGESAREVTIADDDLASAQREVRRLLTAAAG